MAGQFVSVKPFLKDHDITERPKKWKVKIFVLLICVPITGGIFLFTKSNVPWSIMFGIPAICNVVALTLFLSGWRKYDTVDQSKNSPEDDRSPNPFITVLTTLCRVLVASTRKICTSRKDRHILRENNQEAFSNSIFLRFLEKAAIKQPGDTKNDVNGTEVVISKWKLCSLKEVELAKKVLRMAPYLVSYIICGIVSSVGNTYFLEQANNMNQKVGKWNFPFTALAAIMLLWWEIQVYLTEKCYTCIGICFCCCRCINSNKIIQNYHLVQAAWCATLCCIIAALVETRRLKVVRKHDLVDAVGTTPMSVFWLVFQFWMLSGLDASYKRGIVQFFTNDAPKLPRKVAHETKERLYQYFYKGIYGIGYLLSVVSVQLVSRLLCRIGGARYWFQDTLNRSRLDRYYWFLAVLSALNLIICVWGKMLYKCIKCMCPKPLTSENNGVPNDH